MDRWIKATRVLASATAVLRREARAAVVPKEAVLLPVRLQTVVKQRANRMGYPVRFNSYLPLFGQPFFGGAGAALLGPPLGTLCIYPAGGGLFAKSCFAYPAGWALPLSQPISKPVNTRLEPKSNRVFVIDVSY
jgi:hypothetical protein